MKTKPLDIFIESERFYYVKYKRKEKTCCFTGHRIISVGQQPMLEKKLKDKIEKLINKDVIYFGIGGALGFDTMAPYQD